MNKLQWIKSSRSNDNGGQCVELAAAPTGVAFRDSKNPQNGHEQVSAANFGAFLGAVKSGQVDL